jgi:hypothetical protein
MIVHDIFFIILGCGLIISLPFQYYMKTIVVQFSVFLEIHQVRVLENFMRLAFVFFHKKHYLQSTLVGFQKIAKDDFT